MSGRSNNKAVDEERARSPSRCRLRSGIGRSGGFTAIFRTHRSPLVSKAKLSRLESSESNRYPVLVNECKDGSPHITPVSVGFICPVDVGLGVSFFNCDARIPPDKAVTVAPPLLVIHFYRVGPSVSDSLTGGFSTSGAVLARF